MPPQKGSVKFFCEKGFGFINGEDGQSYFVHFSGIKKEGFKSLQDGEEVEFEVESDPKSGKPRAVNVTGPGGAPPIGAPRQENKGKGKGKGKDNYSGGSGFGGGFNGKGGGGYGFGQPSYPGGFGGGPQSFGAGGFAPQPSGCTNGFGGPQGFAAVPSYGPGVGAPPNYPSNFGQQYAAPMMGAPNGMMGAAPMGAAPMYGGQGF
jgi:cold shock CspA family protein